MAVAGVEKLDLKKTLKALYSAPLGKPVIVDVPPLNYLMVDGTGDPNTSPAYAAALEALYGVAYTLKFTIKRAAKPIDYVVMPLEGLWWADDMQAFTSGDRAKWHWTAMILQPDFISLAQVHAAIAACRQKKPSVALDRLRFERVSEGRAAQLMHLGPYATEANNIQRLHAFIATEGGSLGGKHHEIYLSDPRRVAPEKLKTIIRQPFTP